MDARFEEDAKDFAQVGLEKRGSTDNLVQGPVLNGSTEYHTDSSDEETTECSQVGHISANQSPTDEMSASESACLLTLQGLNPTSSAETEPSDTKAPAVASSACSFKNGHVFPKEESSRAPPICTPPTAAANRPRPLCTHSPGCGGFCEAEKKHASSGSSPKSQRSLKTSTSQIQGAAGDDLCASVLLACLFCQLCDCLLATAEGCRLCFSSLCSSLCCCDASSLEVLLGFAPRCSCGGCLEPQGCLCGGTVFDCSVLDLCFHTTECLELGMEISQILFH